ncbi:MAG TPA: DUF488 domain-containing protein [Candidatus Saccharimonadales bacterium]|nr:DUF488 domain-containing protein [Candidatus Saccharimonadales bacterium]
MIKIKRVYEPYDSSDGKRILIDRLWPRGLSKDKAKISLWLKDIAPSAELRKWFGHDPEKWPEFQKRYKNELDSNKESAEALRQQLKDGSIILVYGAKDEKHNDAVVLAEYL